MKAKEYIKIVEDKRDMIAEIMIEGMKHWDKQRDVNAYYELYIDLSAEDLNPIWCYWIDCDSYKDTSDSDAFAAIKLGPHGSWTEWIDSIEMAADLIGLSVDDLINAARPWLESEGYIDSDDEIDISHIDLWVSGDPDDPITQNLLNAWAESIDRDYNDVYNDRADHAIDELMRRLQEYARDEEEQEAERAAWARRGRCDSMRIILDTETTGLSPVDDEILELSIIDADSGQVLHSKRYDTMLRFEWPAAERINGISPRDVRGCPEIGSDHDIQRLLDQADWIGGWNIDYDLSMLSAVGVMPRPDAEIVDVMQMDADICGMITPDHPAGRWRKLAVAAEWWGYQPPEGKMYHSSIVDCLATRHVYNQIRKYRSRQETDRLVYGASRIHMEDIMRDAGIIQQQLLQMMRSGTDHDMEIIEEIRHALSSGARYMRAIAHGAQYHDQIDGYKDFQQRVIDALHNPGSIGGK